MSVLNLVSETIPASPPELYVDIIKELNKASHLLSLAIDRYTQACGNAAYCFESGGGAAQTLVDSAKRELLKLVGYDEKYQRAKVSLRRVRNRCPKLVPIHILPYEIMSRILCSVDCCCISKEFIDLCESRNTSITPETYLEVCSWWRRVAMESSYLWTHIDLTPSERHNVKSLERARVFAAQAGQAPLYIHIGAGWGTNELSRSRRHVDHELVEFCASVSSRIQSLDFVCSSSTDTIQSLLGNPLLSTFIPENVTRFCISARAVRHYSPTWPGTISTGLSADEQKQLEDLLRPVTTLKLDSIYHDWTSKAYHRLAELQLVGRQGQLPIPEFQLANILRASPGLQLLHFGIKVQSDGLSFTPDPVNLDDLEVLRLERLDPASQASVLRMVIPGHKPLQVAIKLRDNLTADAPHHTALSAFLSYSHGIQLYLEGIGSNFEPSELLQSVPLDVLALQDFRLGANYQGLRNDQQYSHIRVLHAIQCKFIWGGFQNLLELHSVQKLVSHRSLVIHHGRTDSDIYYEEELGDICPSIEFSDDNKHFLAAASQTWTLSRVHRVLRPLRTKVAALSTSLKKERRSGIPLNTAAPTPTPTRKPPLRRTYQPRRKRKRGSDNSEDDGGQYIPETEKPRPTKPKQPKPERRWSPEVLERMSAVVDAFRVLADVVYDEQMEMEAGDECILKLRDLCVRALATDIEPSAVAAAGPAHDDSDDDGELVDVTNVVDQRFEEIPDHLRRGSIIPYALSMIKQHVDTITPLPQLWNHLLAICMSSSASPSPPNTADVMQICSNLFFAALHQPRSGSRGLASVYRNIVGSGPEKIAPEIFCQTFLEVLTPEEENLDDNYDVPPDFGILPFQLLSRTNVMQSPTRTPARRKSIVPPTPPTYNPSADSDDPTRALFPIRSLLSRSVGHLVAELSPTELLAFVETAAGALLRWVQSDQYIVLSRERPNIHQRKADDVRSLAPRLCARIGDWVAMLLTDVWSRPIGLAELARAALALGQVVEFALGKTSAGVDDTLSDVLRRWTNKGARLDVNDPFCALTCIYFAKHPTGAPLNGEGSKLAALLYRLPLTGRNCNILVGTLSGLAGAQVDDDATPPRRPRPFDFSDPVSPSAASVSPTPEFSRPPPTFLQAIQSYAHALALANCPHLETTFLQLIVNGSSYVGDKVEEMLEEAEARWDKLGLDANDEEGCWESARSKWRWDEITNTWVDARKPLPFMEYVPAPIPPRQRVPKKTNAATTKKKTRRPTEVIAVSSDTEAGTRWGEEDADSDDVFAAIPTPKYTNRYQIRSPIKTRRQSLGLPRPLPVDGSSEDEYQDPAGQRRRNASRRARPSFDWNWGDSESESSSASGSASGSETDKGAESGSEAGESDFDWTRYNSNYHPHDRLPTRGSSGQARSRRSLNQSSTRSSSLRKDSDEENRHYSSGPRPTKGMNRVVSAPAPVVKRQRLVVEIPIPSKKSAHRSSSTASSDQRPILGNHNAPHRHSASSKPKIQFYISPPRRRPAPTPQEITTSTLERLCSQFAQLSSDDDRDMVIDLVEDSQDETEDTCIERRRAMPSSDDMNLFEVVTPAPRK
ncbi:hypothetical protein FRC11_004705, partial [Ceratobasidium sp. 423]